MPNVFISYRRSDTTSGYASWLYSELQDELGPDSVFMDVDSIPYGADFVAHLQSELGRCDVALVLIGPNWLDAADDDGKRRLDDPADFVHIEVASVLRVPQVKVIPVLVDGATMPTADVLPPELESLTRRQALEFHRSGGSSIGQLLTAIGAAEKRPATRSHRPLLLGGAALAAAGLIAALVVVLTGSGGSTRSGAPPVVAKLKTFRATSDGSPVSLRYPTGLHAATLRPDPGDPPTYQFANGDELVTVQAYSTRGPAPPTVNESEPGTLLAWLRSEASRAPGYRQIAAPSAIGVPSAFNSDSALQWTYADKLGSHALYVAALGSTGWVVSARAPSLQTAVAEVRPCSTR
jgi:TIR domain-containing protein